MPYFTGLARVARTTGFPVVETAGWKTNGHRAMSGCQAIIVHHTATTNTTANAPTLDYVRNNKLSHFVLGRDGTIYVTGAGFQGHAGKDSLVSPAHARNATSIGIEAENTGRGEPWPDVQMESYVRLVRALIDEFGLPVSRVYGHKEVALTERGTLGRKVDPTFNMATFRTAVQRGHWSTLTPASTTPEEFTVSQINDIINGVAQAVADISIPVTRSGKSVTRTLATLVSSIDSQGIHNTGRISELEGIVEKLAEKTGLTAAEVEAAATRGAETGAEKAIADGVDFGTATITFGKD